MTDVKLNNTPAYGVKIEESGRDVSSMSLETLVHLMYTERLEHLRVLTQKEITGLQERQEKAAKLREVLKAINAATSTKGELDLSNNEELQNLLKEAKELGADVSEDKRKYNRNERERLVENLRMTEEDIKVQNNLQMQKINRLTNERTETIQVAKSILKTLHDAMIACARAIRGG